MASALFVNTGALLAAPKKVEAVPLSPEAQKAHDGYAAMLEALRSELTPKLPQIDEAKAKVAAAAADLNKQNNVLKMRAKKGEDVKEEAAKLATEIAEASDKALNEDEKYLLKVGASNQVFHYYGSAKFFAQAGKAFAEAMAGMKK